jgi:glycosyltransferase involved in cell wall biosynthesis
LLREAFPDHEVDDVDVFAAMRADRPRALAHAAASAWEFRRELALRQVRPKRAYVASASFGRHVARLVERTIDPGVHRFSIQSQSLWNAAHRAVPHFVFTDHTRLSGSADRAADPHHGTGDRFLPREREIYRDARVVFVRSTHVADTLVAEYGCGPDAVEVVGMGPNGDVPDEPHVGSGTGDRILFVGVDWERKGGPQLVDAVARLRAEHPGVRLEIVGCAPPIGDQPGVTVHGLVPLARVYELQRECDVFCLPTRFEPFGVAVIEAMHGGLPVVGPRRGALPDMVDHEVTGLLYEPDDADGLVDALRTLVTDPAAARSMGEAGRRRARSSFTWDVTMRRIATRISAEVDG